MVSLLLLASLLNENLNVHLTVIKNRNLSFFIEIMKMVSVISIILLKLSSLTRTFLERLPTSAFTLFSENAF